MLGHSIQIRLAQKLASKVAPADVSVLVAGESGTGKELIAQAIHRQSPRRSCPFVVINCAAIPEHLLESELFGHEKGAFTGADRQRIGRFERASGGTLFLDEIGDMRPELQAKILRALETKEIERVGGDGPIAVDVRVVAASNRCLRSDIAQGRFREDLYYRLAVVVIDLVPLRERGEDVLLLAQYFLERYSSRTGSTMPRLSEQARDLLTTYWWPGNVRELKNAMEHAVLMAEEVVHPEHLPDAVRDPGPAARPVGDGGHNGASLQDTERRYIAHVLASVGGNQKRAAGILGIHRNTLRTKLLRLGLI